MQSRAYMKSSEFQARQGWLPFVDAVGIVLEVLEPVKAAAWAWFTEWKKAFRTPVEKRIQKQVQLPLFMAPVKKPVHKVKLHLVN